VRRYATWVIVLNLVLLLGWFVLPQQLIPETVPFIAMLVVRAWQIAIRPRVRLR
jgi:NhaP-type Na+/H+ and K+/H+ antiporter